MSQETHSIEREGATEGQLGSKGSPFPHALAEPHFTPDEIATAWKVSVDVVRRLFENEPDVLVLESRRSFSRRRYRTLRIPRPVAERVYRRLLKR